MLIVTRCVQMTWKSKKKVEIEMARNERVKLDILSRATRFFTLQLYTFEDDKSPFFMDYLIAPQPE